MPRRPGCVARYERVATCTSLSGFVTTRMSLMRWPVMTTDITHSAAPREGSQLHGPDRVVIHPKTLLPFRNWELPDERLTARASSTPERGSLGLAAPLVVWVLNACFAS